MSACCCIRPAGALSASFASFPALPYGTCVGKVGAVKFHTLSLLHEPNGRRMRDEARRDMAITKGAAVL